MNRIDSTTPTLEKRKSHPFWQVFWLTFLVVSLGYAWYSFYVPSNDVSWAENLDSARELAASSDKDVMMFFTGTWCVPCRIMKREVIADKEVLKAINHQIIPVEIDIDNPDTAEIVKQFNIGATPITVFTNPKGEVLDYAVGKMSKEKFLEMLRGI